MFHIIKEIQTLPDYKLNISFMEGQRKIYDIKRLAEQESIFKELIDDEQLFNSVKIDAGGYGIIWNNELDLSCEELWDNGEPKAS
ncbi:Protein of unknown function (DUF2442) [Butyrivibrio fibrisolvens 16/4]|nr:Protein of unknown function (DUF2442) [Butyrivibrio fibrisolvens 16/4]